MSCGTYDHGSLARAVVDESSQQNVYNIRVKTTYQGREVQQAPVDRDTGRAMTSVGYGTEHARIRDEGQIQETETYRCRCGCGSVLFREFVRVPW